MQLARILTSLMLIIVVSSLPNLAHAESLLEKGQRVGWQAIKYVEEHPIQISFALIVAIIVKQQMRNLPWGGNGAAAAAAAVPLIPHAPHDAPQQAPQQGHFGRGEGRQSHNVASMTYEQLLAHAIELSLAEAKPHQELEMGAGEYNFNTEVFTVLSGLNTVEERVRVLTRLLYNTGNHYMLRRDIVAFVRNTFNMSPIEMLNAFHALNVEKYSILKLTPLIHEIDPDNGIQPDFDTIAEDYVVLQAMHREGRQVDDALIFIGSRPRHEVDREILLLLMRHTWNPGKLLEEDLANAKVVIEDLFGEIPMPPLEPLNNE